MDAGYYWAKIKHTGEIEIVEVFSWAANQPNSVGRFGIDETMEIDQVEIIEPIQRPTSLPS